MVVITAKNNNHIIITKHVVYYNCNYNIVGEQFQSDFENDEKLAANQKCRNHINQNEEIILLVSHCVDTHTQIIGAYIYQGFWCMHNH